MALPQFQTLLFDVHNHVGKITLNRPESANAVNLELAQELFHAVTYCADNRTQIRAIILTGTGKLFCGGGDLQSFQQQANLPAYIKAVTFYLHAAISRLMRHDAPVIAAVNGSAGGGGMSLAIACDLVYAAENAKFTVGYTRIGLTLDASSSYFLPRIVGLRRALELSLTNRTLTAQEACDWGLVNRVLPTDRLLSEATALAEQLATGPTRAFGMTKKLLHTSWTETLETQMENESDAISTLSGTADGQEGIASFLEKRKPQFTGE